MRLENKVCLITGSTSGIGAATARMFAAQGARLALTGRNEKRGEEVAASCRQHGGGDVLFVAGDVTRRESVNDVVAATLERYGCVDALVNNAGVIDSGTVVTTTLERLRQVIEVNLYGQFLYAQAVVPIMSRQGFGTIVNNASDWGLVAGPDSVAYCCSKAAVVMLTKTIALDHGEDGIRCNAVCPGDTLTPMVLKERAGFAGASAAEFEAEASRDVPLRRMARPDEIAAVIAFLASDESSFMTGSIVTADGGNTCR